MIESCVEAHGLARSLVSQLLRIIPPLNVDDPQWWKVDELLEMTLYRAQIDMPSLQDSTNRLWEQQHVISAPQEDFFSATDVQTIKRRAYGLIPKHTKIARVALSEGLQKQ